MIDTLNFFKANYDSRSYYAKFHGQLLAIKDEQYLYADGQEIVDRFREICKPSSYSSDSEENEFLLLCFWMNKNGYVIKEFPNLLSRPTSLAIFSYDEIRKYIHKKRGTDGTVRWQERRDLCDELTITSSSSFQLLPNDIQEKIQLISTRGAEFDGMTVDEKLQNLNNLIENLLKPDSKKKYLAFDYNDVFFGFISEDDVKQFRKRTHPFRHATEDTLKERASISEDEKKLLADMGVFVVIHIYKYLSKQALI